MGKIDRMKMLIEALRMLMEGEFSGHLKINFSQGSIGRIEKYEEIGHIVTTIADEKNNNSKKEKKDFNHDHS